MHCCAVFATNKIDNKCVFDDTMDVILNFGLQSTKPKMTLKFVLILRLVQNCTATQHT